MWVLTLGEPEGALGAGVLFGDAALAGDGARGGLGGPVRFCGTGGATGGAGASFFLGEGAGLDPELLVLFGPW